MVSQFLKDHLIPQSLSAETINSIANNDDILNEYVRLRNIRIDMLTQMEAYHAAQRND
jgi:hypothetical protein